MVEEEGAVGEGKCIAPAGVWGESKSSPGVPSIGRAVSVSELPLERWCRGERDESREATRAERRKGESDGGRR